MTEDQAQILQMFTEWNLKLEELTKKVETLNAPVSVSTFAGPTKRLSLDDFRRRKGMHAKKRKSGEAKLSSIYTAVDTTAVRYFEDVLNAVWQSTGLKPQLADFFRKVIENFMESHTVQQAVEMMKRPNVIQ